MKIKRLIIAVFAFLLTGHIEAQNKPKLGLIVSLEDSITHTYIGWGPGQRISQKYIAPFQLNDPLLKIAKEYALGSLRKHELVILEEGALKDYYDQKDLLKGKEWKNFREEWFESLKNEFGVDALLLVTNTSVFGDNIRSTHLPVHGYGLYNGPLKYMNHAYVMLEFVLWKKPKPRNYNDLNFQHYQKHIKELHRNTDEKVSIPAEALTKLENPLKLLADRQLKDFFQSDFFIEYIR